jgi:hypothetical protein
MTLLAVQRQTASLRERNSVKRTPERASALPMLAVQRASCACGGGCPGCAKETEEAEDLPDVRVHIGGEAAASAVTYPVRPIFDRALSVQRKPLCSCGGDCPRCQSQLPVQTKLAVSQPGDFSELEADRVADAVMRMPDGLSPQPPGRCEDVAGPPVVQRTCSCGLDSMSDEGEEVRRSPGLSLSAVTGSVVARMIRPRDMVDSLPDEEIPGAVEQTDEEAAQPEPIARAAADGAGPQPVGTSGLAKAIDDACRDGGQPLSRETRQFMGPRFGYDFGGVRIHIDSTAGALARQVQARAFATGNHVFFAPSEFQPERIEGKRLLAHELAHVVQQSKGNEGLDRQVQRSGSGSLNCPSYAGYDKSQDLNNYNCAGLSHRTYDFKSLADTKAALAKGSSASCDTPCDHVGVVKHWLWEYDLHLEDSNGNALSRDGRDFHTVGGPMDGDPMPKDSDEYLTKNGRRKVYGPGTAPSFKPAIKDQARTNDPSDQPVVDSAGKPIYKVRSNFAESCFCLPCPTRPRTP